MQTETPIRRKTSPLQASGPVYNRTFIPRGAPAEQNLLNDFERDEEIKRYRVKLGIADWHHEHAGSHEAWRAGRDEFTNLYELQERLDPMGEIWREVAPRGFAVPQPRVKGGAV